MKTLYLFLLFLGFQFACHSQGVGITESGNTVHPSAGLDVKFSNKGVLVPRVNLLSITDTITIASPANSLLIYNTNPGIVNGNGVGFYFYCLTGCQTPGWKFLYFNENISTGGSEWKFYSSATVTNGTELNFTSLPTHDKWKLVMDANEGDSPGDISLYMRLNNITYTYYGTQFSVGSVLSPFYGNAWRLFYGSTVVNGEIIIAGKPSSGMNSKTFMASLSCNAIYGFASAAYGFLNNDPANLHAINITTLGQKSFSGRFELWYRDNQ